MKIKIFLYLFIILFVFQLSSCKQVNNKRKNSSIAQAGKLNLENINQMTGYADWDSVVMDIVLKKSEKSDSAKNKPERLIENDFLKLTRDTICVHINNEVLTEQSGTYAADEYLEIIVRSLTEIKRIVKAINFKY